VPHVLQVPAVHVGPVPPELDPPEPPPLEQYDMAEARHSVSTTSGSHELHEPALTLLPIWK
jgi:hypothetical protein